MLDVGKGRGKEAFFLVEAANLFHVVLGKLEVSLRTGGKALWYFPVSTLVWANSHQQRILL